MAQVRFGYSSRMERFERFRFRFRWFLRGEGFLCVSIHFKGNATGPETAWRDGALPREGVVAKKFVPSLESLSSLGFEERNLGCPRNFAGMSRTPGGVQKVCTRKVCAHFSFPKNIWQIKLEVKNRGGSLRTPNAIQYSILVLRTTAGRTPATSHGMGSGQELTKS